MASESNTTIMSVKTLIERAFGESNVNRVNFKLIETVLFIISRQLEILEQKVHIAIDKAPEHRGSQLSVTEIKMQAKKKKKSQSAPFGNQDVTIKRISVVRKGRFEKKSGSSLDVDEISMMSKKSRQLDTDETDTMTVMSGHSKSRKVFQEYTTPQRRRSIIKKYVGDTRKSSITIKDSPDIDSSKLSLVTSDTLSRRANDSERTSFGSRKTQETEKESMELLNKRMIKKDSSEKDFSRARKTAAVKDFSATPSRKLNETEQLEEHRERELRIISQRADSQEEADLNPQPMTTTSEIEMQQEKLLIVERVPSESLGTKQAERPLQLSIVTLEQFEELVNEVRDLEARFGDINMPGFPENEQLMRDLRKSASLTDAMGALQLSARLEASEKTLEKMIGIVTELAKSSQAPSKRQAIEVSGEIEAKDISDSETETAKITRGELNKAMNDLYDQILVEMNNKSTQAKTSAEAALITAKNLEDKLDRALELEDRMDDLEGLVGDYTERITTMDTGVSAQMTAYQEHLTQMQFDLEAGIDAMAESLTSSGGDPAAVAELNGKLNLLNIELENTSYSQKELEDMQNHFKANLDILFKQMEVINVMKCDRDEVTDALRDKAGFSDLNGRVTQDEFDAVRGDIEKQIQAAYNKFDGQELVWQKLIEELAREINQKVDYNQVISLRDDINKYLSILNEKCSNLAAIVGEPRTATISRRLIRTGTCLSCSTPAQLIEETHPIVQDKSKPNESGDLKPYKCCFGRPIPHPIDPRAFKCQRYCGGRYTVSKAADLIAPGAIAVEIRRPVTAGVGTDGKMYSMVESEPEPDEPFNKLCSCSTPIIEKNNNAQCYEFAVTQPSFDDPSDLYYQQKLKIPHK